MSKFLISLVIAKYASAYQYPSLMGERPPSVRRPPRFKRSQEFLFRAVAVLILLISPCPCSAAPPTKAVGIVIYTDGRKDDNAYAKVFEYHQLLNTGGGIQVKGVDGRPYEITNSSIKAIVPYPGYATGAKSSPQAMAAKLSETMQTYPASKRFLQPWLDTLQNSPAGRQDDKAPAETPSGGATIKLPDGSRLQGCSLKQISDGKATVAYQGGVRRISLADLDSAARLLLIGTTGEWSFDNPGVSPKDASGKYVKIVCKNGRLLTDAKFLEVTDGSLVFNCGGKTKSIPVDQFPGDPVVLGDKVTDALARWKNNAASTHNSTNPSTSGQATEGPTVPSNTGAPITDGSSFSKKAEDLRKWARDFAASKQTAAASEDIAVKQHEEEFTRAGGVELIEQLKNKAGTLTPFTVIAKLPDESFLNLTKDGGEVYEIRFGRSKNTSILVTKTTQFTSDGEGSMYIISGGTIKVKLQNGFDSERSVFIEGQASAIDELKKLQKLSDAAAHSRSLAEEHRSAAQKVPDQAELCAKFLEQIGARMARLRDPEFIVSPGLRSMGFSASVQDRTFAGVVEAIKQGSMSKIAVALGDLGSSDLTDFDRPAEGWTENIIASSSSFMSVAHGVLSSLEERKFSVDLFSSTQRVTDESRYKEHSAAYVLIPRPDSYKIHRGTSRGGDSFVAPAPNVEIGGVPKKLEPIQSISVDLLEHGSFSDLDAQGRGYISKLNVLEHDIAFCVEKQDFHDAHFKLIEATELQEKAINQDIAAGRLGDEEVVKKAQALMVQYISNLKALVSKF